MPRKPAKKKKEISDLVNEFMGKVVQKYGKLIIAIITFGSAARGDNGDGSDIDILVVIDNTEDTRMDDFIMKLDKEINAIAKGRSKDMNIQTPLTLTEFWGLLYTHTTFKI